MEQDFRVFEIGISKLFIQWTIKSTFHRNYVENMMTTNSNTQTISFNTFNTFNTTKNPKTSIQHTQL